MSNINMSLWEVVLYFLRSAHRFVVVAQDEEAAVKEALSIYNQERCSNLSIYQIVDSDVNRLDQPRILPDFQPPLS